MVYNFNAALNHAEMLFVRERRCLSRGSAGNQRVRALGNLLLNELLELLVIDREIVIHRCYQGNTRALKNAFHAFPPSSHP